MPERWQRVVTFLVAMHELDGDIILKNKTPIKDIVFS